MKNNIRFVAFTIDTGTIYQYLVRVRFIKGGTSFIKDYRTDYLNIGKLFCFLEEKHKDNYTLFPIEYLCIKLEVKQNKELFYDLHRKEIIRELRKYDS